VTWPRRAADAAVPLLFAVLALAPLVELALVALQRPADFRGGVTLPTSLDLGNFARVWNDAFGAALATSALVTVPVVAATTAISTLAGYAFGTMSFRGSRVLFVTLLLGLVVPGEATVIPLYYDLRRLSLTDGYPGLILAETAASVGFGTFWMRAFFRGAPRSLIDAARIDGASSWRILWSVLVPLARPALATLAALTFLWVWNDFLLPLVLLSGGSVATAPVRLALFVGERSSDPTALAAGAVLTSLPPIAVYVALQRHVLGGAGAGSVHS
jgi:raffinose/stachyose/melibiose transport system permease protein